MTPASTVDTGMSETSEVSEAKKLEQADARIAGARTPKQEELHALADLSGKQIVNALRSSSDLIKNASRLAHFISSIEDEDAPPEPALEQIKSLEDLKAAVEPYEEPARDVPGPGEPVRDELGRSFATGKRKDAVARVWVKRGSGKVTVNGKDVSEYFARPVLTKVIDQPFDVANVSGEFDVMATVKGGGISGQASAVKHGISKALSLFDPDLRPALKAAGFLTRDARVVERKKYGKRKARRSFQFSKR